MGVRPLILLLSGFYREKESKVSLLNLIRAPTRYPRELATSIPAVSSNGTPRSPSCLLCCVRGQSSKEQGIVDFTDAEFQQSDVVATEEECLADEVLHLDTMIPELCNVPASTPAKTPRASSIKRKRHQEYPRIEEAFRILKKANKNMEESTKEDMLDF
ncbi:hypothetical protein AVEN_204066-1 [Araneus ventricosus]|uniref:Uncharacterized protein n=1 Tax=Araneus ventricosus TaxID=182803 RepID=A0A4Y2P842_ARAVE|nr:hypothetical protein AVEN_204066-1 [Araneus ventricosus]